MTKKPCDTQVRFLTEAKYCDIKISSPQYQSNTKDLIGTVTMLSEVE